MRAPDGSVQSIRFRPLDPTVEKDRSLLGLEAPGTTLAGGSLRVRGTMLLDTAAISSRGGLLFTLMARQAVNEWRYQTEWA